MKLENLCHRDSPRQVQENKQVSIQTIMLQSKPGPRIPTINIAGTPTYASNFCSSLPRVMRMSEVCEQGSDKVASGDENLSQMGGSQILLLSCAQKARMPCICNQADAQLDHGIRYAVRE